VETNNTADTPEHANTAKLLTQASGFDYKWPRTHGL